MAAWALIGCSGSDPATVDEHEAGYCANGGLSEQDMLAVVREDVELPLADLSHYAPRRAERAVDAVLNSDSCESNTAFRYGAGEGDMTGPALGEQLLGMADPAQVSNGIHTRQHAQAFAFSSDCSGSESRAMLVTIDSAHTHDSIKFGLLERIAADTEDHLGDYWDPDNILISATHTHSGAGGFSHYDLLNVFALGFDEQSYDAVVDGVFKAVQRAHRNWQNATPGKIGFAQGEVLNGNFNRSPAAYVLNPAEERARYLDTSGREVNTNRMMTLLKLQRDDGTPVGMLNWYAIHGTSIGQTYRLLSGDNKGYAVQRFVQDFPRGIYQDGEFVAGFFQSDHGDNSPNPFIQDLDEATLRGRDSEAWFTRGGGRDDYESAMISGYKQYHEARSLWDAAGESLRGDVQAISLALDMTSVVLEEPKLYPDHMMPALGEQRTCEPALGVSFAAGAEDGRGPFTEGAACPMSDDELIPFITDYLSDTLTPLLYGGLPSTLIEPVGCYNPAFALLGFSCHMEKPILLPLAVTLGDLSVLQLQPRTIPLQIVTIGNLAIVGLSWEITTTAGRRLRDAVLDTLQDAGIDYVVLSGLSNNFIHYLTTREEYQQQDYEGASNVFGPWTLDAVIQETTRMAAQLRGGEAATSPYAAARYEDHRPLLFTHLLYAPVDGPLPSGAAYGDVTLQPQARYTMTQDELLVVEARFYSAHLRNELFADDSYLYIEREVDGAWQVVADDDDWFTQLTYLRNGVGDEASVRWHVPPGTPPGTYRIRFQGYDASGDYYQGISDAYVLEGC